MLGGGHPGRIVKISCETNKQKLTELMSRALGIINGNANRHHHHHHHQGASAGANSSVNSSTTLVATSTATTGGGTVATSHSLSPKDDDRLINLP
jgi:hypothetical protein